MKIGIFTLPLVNNYGGILQAYALSRVLVELGHEPWLINLRLQRSKLSIAYLKFLVARTIKKELRGAKFNPSYERDTSEFVTENIPLTAPVCTPADLKALCEKERFEAVILGSDQVFRPSYFADFADCFSLGFLPPNCTRIAYAASFGGDRLCGLKNPADLKAHVANLAKFKAISVRECDGAKIARECFGVDAHLVLDPTLLANKEIYDKFLSHASKRKGFAYILDPSPRSEAVIELLKKQSGLEIDEVNDRGNRIGIKAWLSAIAGAEFVLTDSFHGCVFSIIFNKPFFVLVNASRGASRFSSLLGLFGLEDRALQDPKDARFNATIDWDGVNEALRRKREDSMKFLKISLGS
ncbi:polysaccharide pyruvyl transferase family protein [Campylobacter sp.]|uniref:polysaccharide pyruvyl transferase family protein n=1 Tax=Campylobacter sp. TaxID=205 RepID=UPI0025C62E6F|nr:polysaccharide pyruvyl transferase family protein [Campylobacter sp.]